MRPCLVWLGRHRLLPAQEAFIRSRLGEFVMHRIPFVENDSSLLETIRQLRGRCSRIVVSGTVPLTVFMRLARVQDEAGFELWWAVMREVVRDVPPAVAKRIAMEAPDRRAYQCYGSRCTVYEFERFARLREVRLILEDV